MLKIHISLGHNSLAMHTCKVALMNLSRRMATVTFNQSVSQKTVSGSLFLELMFTIYRYSTIPDILKGLSYRQDGPNCNEDKGDDKYGHIDLNLAILRAMCINVRALPDFSKINTQDI